MPEGYRPGHSPATGKFVSNEPSQLLTVIVPRGVRQTSPRALAADNGVLFQSFSSSRINRESRF